ncbi:MAG TPA: hypothetical protein VF271_05675 [Rhodanobacteraceae bacterium]
MRHQVFHFPTPPQTAPTADALTTFVACAQLMLDEATPEERRRQAEARALAQLPVLRALGVFDLFAVRDPALAMLLRDELAQLDQAPATLEGRPRHRVHKLRT